MRGASGSPRAHQSFSVGASLHDLPRRRRIPAAGGLNAKRQTMSIWHKNGYVCIPVTQEHIEESITRDSSHCMTALAIAAAIPDARRIAVDLQTIRFSRKGLRYVFLTPHIAQDNIIFFDQGERSRIAPFELRMRPAYIARAGKKRRECPSNAELRGTGLTVNPVQLHIGDDSAAPNRSISKEQLRKEAWRDTGHPPQRFTATGERNLDPERIDGLYVPPPKRRTRVARAKVSTAAKGSIPTTLGGRLPPASILSRREFGLRTLRR